MRNTSWIAAILAATCLPASGICADAASETAFVPAKTISRPELKYPEKGEIEALVYVRLIVDTEGMPREVTVVEDRGFHNELFREHAKTFVEGMRFSPATRDGVPVQYGPVIQPVNYGWTPANGEKGIRQEFRNELKKVEKFLKNNDNAGAHFHAEWMLREKTVLQYEYAVLKAQLAQTHDAVGNVDEALAAAREATSRKSVASTEFKLRRPIIRVDEASYQLPKKLILYLLDLRMRLHARRGEAMEAIKTFQEIADLERKMQPDDPRAILAEKLIALLESGKPLAFPATVREEYWSHDLFHRSYTVTNVQGKLGDMHLHCRGHFLESVFTPDTVWSVPDGWDACVVEFYGDKGATFQLVELPAGTSLTPAR